MSTYEDQPTVQLRLLDPQSAAARGRNRRVRARGRRLRPPGYEAAHGTGYGCEYPADGREDRQGQDTAQEQEEQGTELEEPGEPGESVTGIAVRQAFHRFWPLTRGDRRWIVLISGCVVLAVLGETAAILLFGKLTDNALRAGRLAAFWGPAGEWLGVTVLGAIIGYIGNSLAVWTAERFVMRLRARVFSHLQDLPLHFFQYHRTGDLVERLTGDVDAIERMVVSGVVGTMSSAFSVLFFSAAAIWLRWELALATFCLAPLFWLAARRFSGRIKSVARQERVADGAITSVVEESLGSIVLTQAYGRKDAEEKRLRREAQVWMRTSVAGARLSEAYTQIVEVVETVCVLAVIGLGAWEISEGRMTIGQLLAFAAFLGYLYPPIQSLGQTGLTLTAATAGAERLLEILDAESAVDAPPNAVVPQKAHGTVEFTDVGFRYPGAERDSLRGISFAAHPGELVLVTGPSGAGKSTVSKLLLRFYDPDTGAVRLDGTPLDALPLDFVRQTIALLPQKTLILHDTIAENIGCGRSGASEQEITQAARDADAHDFIAALPEGYQTRIDPHTAQLSGGQLQRIAIARAMLRDARVLILDEPTTGLDASAARRVIDPLRRLMADRTTIMITHDLNLAPDADRIVVLDGGRLVEMGRHLELLAHQGAYARLLHSQNGRSD